MFFKSIGKFFSKIGKAIGKFVKNLASDPLGTLVNVLNGATIGFFLGGPTGALYGMLLGLTAVGADLEWLQIGLQVLAAAISIYNLVTDWPALLEQVTDFGFIKTAAFMEKHSEIIRLLFIGSNVLTTMGMLTSIRDGTTLIEGIQTSAYDIAKGVVGVATNVVSGATSGVLSALSKSPLTVLGLGLLGFYLLTKDDSSEKVVIEQGDNHDDFRTSDGFRSTAPGY